MIWAFYSCCQRFVAVRPILSPTGYAEEPKLQLFRADDKTWNFSWHTVSVLLWHAIHKFFLEKSKYQKKIAKLLEKSKRAIENNPSGSGKKKRRCAKPEDESVTPQVVGMIKDVFADSDATFDETIAAMVALLGEFLGRCRVASASWPEKLRKLATQLESERCPVGTDCRLWTFWTLCTYTPYPSDEKQVFLCTRMKTHIWTYILINKCK